MSLVNWGEKHILRIAGETHYPEPVVGSDLSKWMSLRRQEIEPWLSSIFQGEHLSLLLGSGFSTAISQEAGAASAGMSTVTFGCDREDQLNSYAAARAAEMGRGKPNIEDQLSAALILKEGLIVAGEKAAATAWTTAIDRVLADFLKSILQGERALLKGLSAEHDSGHPVCNLQPHQTLISFLLSFASRAAARDRLHLFTTNYDRVAELGSDLAGIRLVDRFNGIIAPIFRSSRLQVDLHYNPPGIRGEPRLLEGVVHFTKLHGSIDWRREDRVLRRVPLAFGADDNHPDVPAKPSGSVMIYPNSAKDIETAAFPYADLFRDFSAAACRPNSVLVTYGYGYGDDHINRVIADMLTLPSTHLVIISYGEDGAEPHARVRDFCERSGRLAQMSLMLGSHFANIRNLAGCYLPKPAIDPYVLRMVQLMGARHVSPESAEEAQA